MKISDDSHLSQKCMHVAQVGRKRTRKTVAFGASGEQWKQCRFMELRRADWTQKNGGV